MFYQVLDDLEHRALCTLGHLEAAADALHHMLHFISSDGTATSKAAASSTQADEAVPASSHSQEARSHLPSSQGTGQESQPGFSPSQAASKGPLSQEPQPGFSPSQAAGKGSLSQKPQSKGARGRYKESRHHKLKRIQQACHVVMTLGQRRAQPAVMLPILESMQQVCTGIYG